MTRKYHAGNVKCLTCNFTGCLYALTRYEDIVKYLPLSLLCYKCMEECSYIYNQ